MTTRLCHKASWTLCAATKLSSSGGGAVRTLTTFPLSMLSQHCRPQQHHVPLPHQPQSYPHYFQQQHQHQQVRFAMTKAKKKRIARALRRKEMEEQGIEISKPPGYFPKDTPVENVVPPDVLAERIQKHDEKVKKELETKRAILAQQQQLRFQMTGLTMSDRVKKLFDLNNGNQREVVQYQKHSGMKLFELREGDTGSSAVQGNEDRHVCTRMFVCVLWKR